MKEECKTCIHSLSSYIVGHKRDIKIVGCSMDECRYEPCYEIAQKQKWKNYEKRWDFMSNEEKCLVAYQLLHTTYLWVPKAFIYTVFEWFYTELVHERITVASICEQKRNEFKVLEASDGE